MNRARTSLENRLISGEDTGSDMPLVLSYSQTQASMIKTQDMAWLVEHADELLKFRGEWILIAEQKLIAHNRNFSSIKEIADRNSIAAPFMFYIPSLKESGSTL
jgi:hypothetical protein